MKYRKIQITQPDHLNAMSSSGWLPPPLHKAIAHARKNPTRSEAHHSSMYVHVPLTYHDQLGGAVGQGCSWPVHAAAVQHHFGSFRKSTKQSSKHGSFQPARHTSQPRAAVLLTAKPCMAYASPPTCLNRNVILTAPDTQRRRLLVMLHDL